RDENVADLIRRSDRAQEAQGGEQDTECNLLVVGNGGAGNTSLVRMLLGAPHQGNEGGAPGIHLARLKMDPVLFEGAASTKTVTPTAETPTGKINSRDTSNSSASASTSSDSSSSGSG